MRKFKIINFISFRTTNPKIAAEHKEINLPGKITTLCQQYITSMFPVVHLKTAMGDVLFFVFIVNSINIKTIMCKLFIF